MKVYIKLRIKSLTPIHVGSGFGKAGIIDKAVVKDNNNYVHIPGSSIKGRLRSNASRLAKQLKYNDDIILRLFGTPQKMCTLRFGDAKIDPEMVKNIASLADFQTETITGVGIDRRRHIAKEQHLYTSEYATEFLEFISEIEGFIDNTKANYPKELMLLIATLLFTTHLGGGRSRGMGKVKIKIDKCIIDGLFKKVEDILEFL